jgi:hypothetical protein
MESVCFQIHGLQVCLFNCFGQQNVNVKDRAKTLRAIVLLAHFPFSTEYIQEGLILRSAPNNALVWCRTAEAWCTHNINFRNYWNFVVTITE